MAKATFAAGCFWGVEDAFRRLPGVTSTSVGYTGGHTDQPTYRDVCGHRTGHAEAVEVEFDSEQVSYQSLVERFFALHDPSQVNRQGPDVGDQYRSAIFFHDPAQQAVAAEAKAQVAAASYRPVVTEIVPATTFWRAEEYHQQYVEKRGGGACRI
ncbi:MAG: peptide-methionine (S)-S-oxide reductase MsrA [Candidatus Dormiibacterota bacterium]|jgi:peptide-methionine (S)-S-oxide reductase